MITRLAFVLLVAFMTINAQIPREITTPDKVEPRIGTLESRDGAPSKQTLEKVYDNLDLTFAQSTTLQGSARGNLSSPNGVHGVPLCPLNPRYPPTGLVGKLSLES